MLEFQEPLYRHTNYDFNSCNLCNRSSMIVTKYCDFDCTFWLLLFTNILYCLMDFQQFLPLLVLLLTLATKMCESFVFGYRFISATAGQSVSLSQEPIYSYLLENHNVPNTTNVFLCRSIPQCPPSLSQNSSISSCFPRFHFLLTMFSCAF